MTAIVLAFVVPSVIAAVSLTQDNNFERNVEAFIRENKVQGRSYIYDYRIYSEKGRKVEVSVAGEPMTFEQQTALYSSARNHHIKEDQLVIREHMIGMSNEEMNSVIKDIYDKTDRELAEKEVQMLYLQSRLDSLSRLVESLVVSPPELP